MKKQIIILLSLLCLLLTGCGGNAQMGGFDSYSAAEITVSGLTEDEFTVSIGQLAELEAVKRPASATRANGEKVSITAVGPLLDSFLAQYGYTQTDFSRIRFAASDGYSIAVDAEVLAGREIVLALSDGGKALSGDDQPLRVVIPGERAMYWVRHLNRIEFESGEAVTSCRSLVFLEIAAATLTSEDYEYNGSTDKAIAAADLLAAFGGVRNDGTLVNLLAADGLSKTETEANFLSMNIKYTGADSPRLVGESLPEGMQVYDLVWIGYGETRFLSLPLLLKTSGEESVFFSDLLKQAEFISADSYIIDAADGSYQTLNAASLAEAVVNLDAQCRVNLDLGADMSVNNVLRIEAVQ